MPSVYKKIFTVVLLLFIFAFSLFFRIFFVYNIVLSDPIKYSADDGVYHMRLVENELLGNHFPKRITFDPYAYFPYGAYPRVAPLYDQTLSAVIWILSLGNPTQESINNIAPFYPPVLGSFLIVLVYFLAKKVWGNKRIAFFCSFIAAIYTPFFSRSLLGDTDHHILEVISASFVMLFLFVALKARKSKEGIISLSSDWLKKEIVSERKFWIFTLLLGLSLWLYFLTWTGALLFLFIIFVFIISYYLIEYFLGKSKDWILMMGIVVFLITLITVLPFSNHYASQYNIYYSSSMIIGILGFIFLALSNYFIKKKELKRWIIIPIIFISGIIFILFLNYFLPSVLKGLLENFQAVNNSLNSNNFFKNITAEMRPIGFEIFALFSYLVICALISFCFIVYRFIKYRKPEDWLLIIWGLIMALMCGIIPFFGQARFIYYFSIVISLMSGFLIAEGLKFGWRGIKFSYNFSDFAVRKYILIGSIVIVFSIFYVFIFPFPLNLNSPFPQNIPVPFQAFLDNAKNGLIIQIDDWYESLGWLRENTPDPGVDYYALYDNPEINKETQKPVYPYPSSAYGVLARWDVGHMITYYAHRPTNANNFQYGAGVKKENEVVEAGEAVFFLESEEEKAIKYLDDLRTKYVITDFYSASPEAIFASKVMILQGNLDGYLENKESAESPSKFDNSMIARLHILDGRETTTKRKVEDKELSFYIKPLDHFRLVFESKTTVSFSSQDLNNEIKAVKIFEYVKGARITGKAVSGGKVYLSSKIKTNQGREFVYQKEIEAVDGIFSFTVPYSTFKESGWIDGQTKFSVFADPYKIKIGEKEIEVNVSEKEILEGEEIKIK